MEVSVIVATYSPDETKLKDTINSILLQKNIEFEIIIADDGSKDNKFSELKEIFINENIKFIENKLNQGTVKNLYSGLLHASGKWVKFISPGDMLFGTNSLRSWVDNMILNDTKISYSDAIYYARDNEGNWNAVKMYANPQRPKRLGFKDSNIPKQEYLINDDICLGAAIMSERVITTKYIELILNKVTYAEDNIYRIMLYDGERISYNEAPTMLYEVGTGISTSGDNKWSELIKKDWNETNKIIIARDTDDLKFKRKFERYIMLQSRQNFISKIKIYLLNKEKISMRLCKLFKKRYTNVCSLQEFREIIQNS